jgi:hypothetical protein
MKLTISVLVLCFVVLFPLSATRGDKSNVKVNGSKNLLVVGFGDQVHSNYYPRIDIAQKLETGLDNLDITLNQKFLDSFNGLRNNRVNLVKVKSYDDISAFRRMFSFVGSEDELSLVPTEVDELKLGALIKHYEADYIIVYSQYYLKRQEAPFNTLFHIFNYKLFDNEMNELMKGQEYFNTFDLVSADELSKQFQRAIRKNMSSIARHLD